MPVNRHCYQQSQIPGKPAERAKSINQLYGEQGIALFTPFVMDRSDVSFAARLMTHWANLDVREPSVKIVCRNYGEKPQPGLHNWDCPNLLWELMRTRRVKLTAQQLLSRNLAEAIVDKDNHARDVMKYIIMSHPEPSREDSRTARHRGGEDANRSRRSHFRNCFVDLVPDSTRIRAARNPRCWARISLAHLRCAAHQCFSAFQNKMATQKRIGTGKLRLPRVRSLDRLNQLLPYSRRAHNVTLHFERSYSCLNASIGSSREARIAGIMPLISPTAPRISVDAISVPGAMIRRMSPASPFFAKALYKVSLPTESATA